jgi:hypothetical protein
MRYCPPTGSLIAAVAAIMSAAACASTGTSSDSGTTITTRTLSSPGNRVVETTDVTGGDEILVKASPSETMSALTQIYGDLQVPIGTMIPEHGQIGNLHLRLPTHRLHGHLLSYYLNCGQESMVGLRADMDDVTMSVLSTVRTGKDNVTRVATTVTAFARPSGTSSNPVDCESTGALEKAIASQLTKTLGNPADAAKAGI